MHTQRLYVKKAVFVFVIVAIRGMGALAVFAPFSIIWPMIVARAIQRGCTLVSTPTVPLIVAPTLSVVGIQSTQPAEFPLAARATV